MQKEKAPKEELENLLEQIKQRHTEALKTLYELTSSEIFAFSLSIVKNYHDAEDIMHNTFITIFKNASLYIKNTNPKAWIFTITKNIAYSKIRKDQKEYLITDEEIDEIHKHHPSFNTEDKILLQTLLNHLTTEERNIVIMHAISGFKHKEISQILSIPLSTVLSKYNRSIKKLNALLKEEL